MSYCGFITLQHLKKKNRVKMLEYFIDVAKECINIGNFNSLMAIIGEFPVTSNLSKVRLIGTYTCRLNSSTLCALY